MVKEYKTYIMKAPPGFEGRPYQSYSLQEKEWDIVEQCWLLWMKEDDPSDI